MKFYTVIISFLPLFTVAQEFAIETRKRGNGEKMSKGEAGGETNTYALERQEKRKNESWQEEALSPNYLKLNVAKVKKCRNQLENSENVDKREAENSMKRGRRCSKVAIAGQHMALVTNVIYEGQFRLN